MNNQAFDSPVERTDSSDEYRMSQDYPQDIPNEAFKDRTKRIPNLLFLGLASASAVGSALLTLKRRQRLGTLVGLWVPSILILWLYNKLVKIEEEFLKHAEQT